MGMRIGAPGGPHGAAARPLPLPAHARRAGTPPLAHCWIAGLTCCVLATRAGARARETREVRAACILGLADLQAGARVAGDKPRCRGEIQKGVRWQGRTAGRAEGRSLQPMWRSTRSIPSHAAMHQREYNLPRAWEDSLHLRPLHPFHSLIAGYASGTCSTAAQQPPRGRAEWAAHLPPPCWAAEAGGNAQVAQGRMHWDPISRVAGLCCPACSAAHDCHSSHHALPCNPCRGQLAACALERTHGGAACSVSRLNAQRHTLLGFHTVTLNEGG